MEENYTSEITVSNAATVAYKALTTGFNSWWTTGCNAVSEMGDEITFRFGSTYWVMRAADLIPGKLVELECIDAHHVHEGLPPTIENEWQGSRLKWDIQSQGERTKITMIHEGLVPALQCFDVCEQGWDYYFCTSLKQYLDTGKGSPFEHEA